MEEIIQPRTIILLPGRRLRGDEEQEFHRLNFNYFILNRKKCDS